MRKLAFTVLFFVAAVCSAQTVTVDLRSPGKPISPHMWGIFFEDINYSADGGLNPDLIQNGSFEYYPFFTTNSPEPVNFTPMSAWEVISEEGGQGRAYVSGTTPLNPNNPHNLEILQTEERGWFGVSNLGYDGMVVEKGKKYDFSAYVSVWKQRASTPPPSSRPERGQQPGGERTGGDGPPPQGGMSDMGNIDITALMRDADSITFASIRREVANCN